MNTSEHAQQIAHGDRFEFGKNWSRFLEHLDEGRIRTAEQSVRDLVALDDLRGKRFLDIGSGSGLFSLAARRLGAVVHSFDYDPQSVACTAELKRRYFPDDPDWTVEEGSALDPGYVDSLGRFDIVYSWGVLHHTGDMWRALDHAHRRVADDGILCIAIYNDRGAESVRWSRIKKTYCSLPRPLRSPFAIAVMLPREAKLVAKSLLALRPREYLHLWTQYHEQRGMSRWHDIVDWVGGYPYEYATPDAITDFFADRGFTLVRLNRTNGTGCNEFVLHRASEGQTTEESTPELPS